MQLPPIGSSISTWSSSLWSSINLKLPINLVRSQQQECLHCLQAYSPHILHCINIRLSRNSDGIINPLLIINPQSPPPAVTLLKEWAFSTYIHGLWEHKRLDVLEWHHSTCFCSSRVATGSVSLAWDGSCQVIHVAGGCWRRKWIQEHRLGTTRVTTQPRCQGRRQLMVVRTRGIEACRWQTGRVDVNVVQERVDHMMMMLMMICRLWSAAAFGWRLREDVAGGIEEVEGGHVVEDGRERWLRLDVGEDVGGGWGGVQGGEAHHSVRVELVVGQRASGRVWLFHRQWIRVAGSFQCQEVGFLRAAGWSTKRRRFRCLTCNWR